MNAAGGPAWQWARTEDVVCGRGVWHGVLNFRLVGALNYAAGDTLEDGRGLVRMRKQEGGPGFGWTLLPERGTQVMRDLIAAGRDGMWGEPG